MTTLFVLSAILSKVTACRWLCTKTIMLTSSQIEGLRDDMGIAAGDEWRSFAGLKIPETDIQAFLNEVPFKAKARAVMQLSLHPRLKQSRLSPVISGKVPFPKVIWVPTVTSARLQDVRLQQMAMVFTI